MRPRYGQTLVQNGALWAVSRQARAPTETPVRTDTCTEWNPPGCQPSDEGTHKDPGTDRHLYRMEPSGLLAVRRGYPQRPRYGQTVVQNGALRAVSPQPRAPTVTCYGQTLVHLYRMEPSGLSGEGHRDPGTDRHLYRMQLSAVRQGHPQRPITDRHLYRMEPSEVSVVRRGHPQRPRYGQTLVNYGALQAVSRQARAPTETAVRTDTCTEWSPPGCEPSDEGTHRDPSTDRHLYRMEPSGLSAVRRGHPQRTPVRAVRRGHPQRPWYGQTLVQNGPLRAVRRGLQRPRYGQALVQNGALWAVRRGYPQSPRYGQTLGQNGALWAVAVRRGHPQRPWYGQTLVQNGALRAVSPQARAHTETPVRTDTCTEWSPLGCQPSGEGTYRDPSTDRHLDRMEPSGLSGEGYRDPGTDRHSYRMEPSGLSAVR
ncbi:hypothetical protein NDU88_006639 [Pleurodeles waltl]|uniref:Uncharacterized protein n=1 Tax=Pleurodeles waltl TaxID=8319 RepID=A0AAV7LAT9_PLEWA|nr:hypothetical protein NDU88_006639 [Pleurodeles waltl]